MLSSVLHAVLIQRNGVSRKAHGGKSIVLGDGDVAGPD